jgi:hypothetical protein
VKPEEIISDNPFFQHKTSKQKGCQFDYLIQTRHNTLFACEIKFLRKEIDVSVIHVVKEKIAKFTLPRGFSCLPVLIHANGVSDKVKEADYFFKIIDFSEMLYD